MAGYDPVIATFEATTAPAIEAVARYEEALGALQGVFDRVAEASGVLDERLAVAERGFQTAAVESNTLSSELTGLEERLGAAGSGAKTLASGMNSIGKSGTAAADGLLAAGDGAVEFGARFGAVEEELSMFAGRVEGISTSLVGMTTAFSDSTMVVSRALADINTEIMATAAALKEVAAGVDVYSTGMARAATATKTMAASQQEAALSVKDAAKTLGLIGAALDLTDVGAAKMAGNFQSNMNRLQTEAGLSSDRINAFAGSMGGLGDKVVDVGNQTGFTGVEIANSLYEPVSAGLALGDALNTVKYAAEEAKISGATLEDTTFALTATMKDFGGSVKSPEQGIADLNAIVGQGMMRFQDFNQAIKNWAPTAATFGVSLNSAGAGLAFMTDRGESAQSAGTKLAQVMAMMVGQTTQAGKLMGALGLSTQDVATSNEAMAGAMHTAHISTSQLAEDLRKPDGLAVALNDLKSHLEGAGLSADAANSVLVRAFGGGRQFKGLAELISDTGQLQQKFDQISHDSNISHFEEQWNTVSNSFNQAWSSMTASLKNFAMSIGTTILPIVGTVVKFLGDMFTSIGQNKGLVDALGTAMLTLSVALPIAGLVSFISNLSATSKAVLGFAGNITVLLTSLTYGIEHINSWSGALALAAGGILLVADALRGLAAAGVALGAIEGLVEFLSGPWGIVLAGAAVAVAIFAGGNDTAGKAVDGLTDAIKQDSGELGHNTEAWIQNNLTKTGAYQAAKNLGIGSDQVTAAVMGNTYAMGQINGVLDQHKENLGKSGKAQGEFSRTSTTLTGDAKTLKDALDSTSGSVSASKDAYDAQASAADKSKESQDAQTKAVMEGLVPNQDLTNTTQNLANALSDAQSKASALKSALDLLNGGYIDAEQANISYRNDLDTLQKSLQKNGKTIDDNTSAGRENMKTILDAAVAAQQHAEAVAKQEQSVDKGTEAFNRDRDMLDQVMRQAGFTEAQVQDMNQKFLQTPHITEADIKSNVGDVLSSLQLYTNNLHAINGTNVVANVTTYYRGINVPQSSATGGQITHKATGGSLHRDYGGPVAGMGTESSDSIPTMLSDHEFVIRARSANAIGTGVLTALNSGDLDTAYRLLGQRPDVNRGSSAVNTSELAGLLGGGGGKAAPPVIVNVMPRGSILAENDLRRVVQDVVLKYTARNSSPGWTPRFT